MLRRNKGLIQDLHLQNMTTHLPKGKGNQTVLNIKRWKKYPLSSWKFIDEWDDCGERRSSFFPLRGNEWMKGRPVVSQSSIYYWATTQTILLGTGSETSSGYPDIDEQIQCLWQPCTYIHKWARGQMNGCKLIAEEVGGWTGHKNGRKNLSTTCRCKLLLELFRKTALAFGLFTLTKVKYYWFQLEGIRKTARDRFWFKNLWAKLLSIKLKRRAETHVWHF